MVRTKSSLDGLSSSPIARRDYTNRFFHLFRKERCLGNSSLGLDLN